MKLDIGAFKGQNKEHKICEIKPLKTVEGEYRMLICENKKIKNKSD
jgi:hypothetical protein